MNIKENQRYKAIGNILQPEGVNSILMAYVQYNRFFDLAIDLLNMPIDRHPIENGCIVKTGAEIRTIIVSGKIISGQC